MENSKIAFMPGCSLAAYSPSLVEKVLEYLKGQGLNNLKGVQDCCGNPYLMLGEEANFKKGGALGKWLEEEEIRFLIVACQNCYLTLKEDLSGKNIKVLSLWQVLSDLERVSKKKRQYQDKLFTIHDSCATRFNPEVYLSVRDILVKCDYNILESQGSRELAKCCGLGGFVSEKVQRQALKQAEENLATDFVITYCCGCNNQFKEKTTKNSFHLLEIFFNEFEKKQKKKQGFVERYFKKLKTKKIINNFNSKT